MLNLTFNIAVAVAAIMAGMLAATSVPVEQSPIERINQAFDAATARPLQNYSVARKGDVLVPTPVKTLTCTKQFCDPHPKNLENLPPQHRKGLP